MAASPQRIAMAFDTMTPIVQDLMNSSIWDGKMFVNG
jgi:hypothetical protein